MKLKQLNGKYVGYPCTPSRWVGEPEYKKITAITMSCGGGMGGSKWNEYVTRIIDSTNGMEVYERIDGKLIKLNSKYMVKMEDFTLVTVKFETSNSNYYPENVCVGKTLPYTKWVPLQKQFIVEDGQKVVLLDEYESVAKKMNRMEGWD